MPRIKHISDKQLKIFVQLFPAIHILLRKALSGIAIIRKQKTLYTWKKKRRTRITKYLNDNQLRKLQIGTATNFLPGWLNTDLEPLIENEICYMDATKPFPFSSDTFDYIFHEHVIEHLTLEDGEKTMTECFRILKNGGKVRIATPDFYFLVELCSPTPSEIQMNYLNWSQTTFLPNQKMLDPAFVLNNFFRAWGHQFIYNEKVLSHVLHKAGFRNIKRYNQGQSDDQNLRNLEKHGMIIGPDMNRIETMILEAEKII